MIGKVLGEVAGTIQTAVNTAASVVLYQFEVKGTTDAPKIAAIPAPALTSGAAKVFGTMLSGGGKLADVVKDGVEGDANAP